MFDIISSTSHTWTILLSFFHVPWMILAAYLLVNLVGAILNNYDQILSERRTERKKQRRSKRKNKKDLRLSLGLYLLSGLDPFVERVTITKDISTVFKACRRVGSALLNHHHRHHSRCSPPPPPEISPPPPP